MKLSTTVKTRSTILVLMLGLAHALPASAQSRTDTDDTVAANTDTVSRTIVRDDNFEWGWVGLLGLIGLAGLRRRHDAYDSDTRSTSVR